MELLAIWNTAPEMILEPNVVTATNPPPAGLVPAHVVVARFTHLVGNAFSKVLGRRGADLFCAKPRRLTYGAAYVGDGDAGDRAWGGRWWGRAAPMVA